MNFTKKEMLHTLNDIKEENNIDVSGYIDDVIFNDIPSKSIKFINKYKPIEHLGVFNLIRNKGRRSSLFKNLVKNDINNYEQSITLSSLLTQMLCYIKTTQDDVVKHSDLIGMTGIIQAMNELVTTGSFDKINITYLEISNMFKDLFYEGGEKL